MEQNIHKKLKTEKSLKKNNQTIARNVFRTKEMEI